MIPFRMMQFQLRSNVGLIVHHARQQIRKERDIRKIVRKLKKYKPELVDKLNRKYIKKKEPDRDKFNEKLAEEVREFLGYYQQYRQYFQYIMRLFNEANIASDRQEVTTIQQASSLMDDVIKRSGLRFTEKSKSQFIKQYTSFMKRLERMIKLSQRFDIRIYRGRRMRIPFLKRVLPPRLLNKHERRRAMKVGSDYLKMRDSEDIIRQELEHGVRQDLLILLLQYVRYLEMADINIASIQEDLRILVTKETEQYEKDTHNLVPFLELVRNEKELKKKGINPEQIHQDMVDLRNELKKFAAYDRKDMKYIKNLLKFLETKKKALEAVIKVVA